MSTLVNIITNAVFVGFATLVIAYFLNNRLQTKIEKLKSDLQVEQFSTQEMLNKKRLIYIELVESMSIFIGQRIPPEEQRAYKRRFLNAYDASWLWASDSVLKALSVYMALKLNPTTEAEEKEAFVNVIIEMRKDLGYSSSEINNDDYKFINL